VDKTFAALLKSPAWLLLVTLGVLAFIWAALPSSTVIAGAHIGLDGSWRYGVAVVGLVLMIFGIFFGLISSGLIGGRAEQGEALPIKNITINSHQTSLQPYPKVRLSGEVTPKKAGVNVWLVREDLAQYGGSFFPTPRPATTNGNGQWEQSVSLWTPGPFRVYAVVTTEEYGDFYRLYRSAYDVALKDLGANHVPDWPFFDALPKVSVVADTHVTLHS
jgi:hypothetical protein